MKEQALASESVLLSKHKIGNGSHQHIVTVARALIISSLFALLLPGCSSVMFYPQDKMIGTPERLGLDYEDVYYFSEDHTRIHAWLLKVPPDKDIRGTVFFLHGNGANISYHVDHIAWLPEQGYQVFLLDYRGYGLSLGEPTLPEVFADIRAGFDWMMAQKSVRTGPVYVLGQSLGASLAGYWMGTDDIRRAQVAGVALDAGFANYADLVQSAWSNHWLTWPLQYPARWIIENNYSAGPVIHRISPTPLFVIHSVDDQVVPFRFGKALFDAAKQPKEFLQTQGFHVSTFDHKTYQEKLLHFFRTHQGSSVLTVTD